MKLLIQNVTRAHVTVDDKTVGQVGAGMVVFVGIDADDDVRVVERMIIKLLKMRIFKDSSGKINLSVSDIGGDILVISQFTLSADTSRGLRPGFSSAASPEQALQLFDFAVDLLKNSGLFVQVGQFGAQMLVELVNDGPSTFWINSQE